MSARRVPGAALALQALLVLTVASCTDTGRSFVEVPLHLSGTRLAPPLVAKGGVEVRLDSARLAFGPLVLCAGTSAGELCETALLEQLETSVIDALDPVPRRAGSLVGVTGTARSYMYDLGLSSQLTRTEPAVLAAAAELGGNSLVIEGSFQTAGVTVPFLAQLPVQQTGDTERGVPVIRKSPSEDFSHEVTTAKTALLIRFDPGAWLGNVDFRDYLEEATCLPDGPSTVCAEQTELSCDASGEVVSSRDCQAEGEVCLRGRGCTSRLTLQPEEKAYRSLRNALLTSRPHFTWGEVP